MKSRKADIRSSSSSLTGIRPSASGAKIKDAFAKAPAAGTERVLCLDADTGKEIWKHEYDCPYKKLSYPSGPRCTPTVHGGKVYTLGAMGHLFCLDAKDGKVIWSKELSKETKEQNAKLKDKYKPDGYPTIVFITANGNELGRLVGFDGDPKAWSKEAADIVKKALSIAGELCIYTNQNHVVETL